MVLIQLCGKRAQNSQLLKTIPKLKLGQPTTDNNTVKLCESGVCILFILHIKMKDSKLIIRINLDEDEVDCS